MDRCRRKSIDDRKSAPKETSDALCVQNFNNHCLPRVRQVRTLEVSSARRTRMGSFKGVSEDVRRERKITLSARKGMERASSRNGKEDSDMKNRGEKGAAGYIAAWALGVPVSLLLIVFLLRGCT